MVVAVEVGELLEACGGADQLLDLRLPLAVKPAAGAGVERGHARQRGGRLLERVGALRGEPVGRRGPERLDRLTDPVKRELPIQVAALARRSPRRTFRLVRGPVNQPVAGIDHTLITSRRPAPAAASFA